MKFTVDQLKAALVPVLQSPKPTDKHDFFKELLEKIFPKAK